MDEVPPAVIVPPVMDHKYAAPLVVVTLAVLPVELAHTEEAAGVIVWSGMGLKLTVTSAVEGVQVPLLIVQRKS